MFIIQYSLITELTGQVYQVPQPSHVFELKYNDASEEKFRELQGGRDIIYAVHGSRVENFHSIINHGLKGHMSKVGGQMQQPVFLYFDYIAT